MIELRSDRQVFSFSVIIEGLSSPAISLSANTNAKQFNLKAER